MKSRRLWRLIIVNLTLILLLSELSVRVIATYLLKVPFFHQERMILNYYPELKPFLLQEIPLHDSTEMRVLILGGSVVTNTLCNLQQRLNDELEPRIRNKKIKIYNLSEYAHNSWDSRIKMEYLRNFIFDYVFLYHGINDTRANNCPATEFKNDYSHIEFYSQVQTIRRHPGLRYFALPYYIDRMWQQMLTRFGLKRKIPQQYFVLDLKLLDPPLARQADSAGLPGWYINNIIKSAPDKIVGLGPGRLEEVDQQWLKEGKDIKSAEVFRKNFGVMLQIASGMNARVILSSYAFYLPKDYSLKKFLHEKMDYGEQRWPVEIYGLPENVIAGIEKHNAILDSIRKEDVRLLYFDFNHAVPHDGNFFNDVCHLASPGCQQLSDSVAVQIIRTYPGPQ